MLSSLLQVAIASLIDFCFNVLFGQEGQVYGVVLARISLPSQKLQTKNYTWKSDIDEIAFPRLIHT